MNTLYRFAEYCSHGLARMSHPFLWLMLVAAAALCAQILVGPRKPAAITFTMPQIYLVFPDGSKLQPHTNCLMMAHAADGSWTVQPSYKVSPGDSLCTP